MSLDETLGRLSTLFSQVSGVDKAYRITIYFLRIVAVSIAKRHGPKHPLVLRIAAFTSPLADTRMILRFFGLIPIIQALRRPPAIADTFLRQLDRLQTYSMLIYYPTEHLYWLGEHKVLDVKDPGRWSRISCMAWAFWIVLDLVVVTYQLEPVQSDIKSVKRKLSELNTMEKSDEEVEAQRKLLKESLTRLRNGKQDLKLRLMALAADLPLAIHWSLPSYPLPDIWVGIFGVLSTVAGSYLKWKYTK